MDGKIAIIAVAYNRIDSLKRLLDSLSTAHYTEDVALIISVDKSKSNEVEFFSDKYNWVHGQKIVDRHPENLGLRNHMMSLGKWFNKFEALVVLEDDIVVSPNFFDYVSQTVAKYHLNDKIAGISLYAFSINYQNNIPFVPVKDENDVYFMNCAQSWGEVWIKNSWLNFYAWYKDNLEFTASKHIPKRIINFGPNSWLKYHIRYCIENNKYFVYPYVSLSTNCSDVGIHNSKSNTLFQVPMQQGEKKNFTLPDSFEKSVVYDGFFENKKLYNVLGIPESDLCLDLNNLSNNSFNKRYWLTPKRLRYKVINSYGLMYKPIEQNVIMKIDGKELFLYDTNKNDTIPHSNKNEILYRFQIYDIMSIIRLYGITNTLKEFLLAIVQKIR